MTKEFFSNLFRFLKQHKAHLFPVIIIVILLVLTCLRISGSSIGIYHTYLYGDKKDPHLLYGKPQPIRSDEWLVATQVTVAQANSGFRVNNTNFNGNQDVSVILDVPYGDWSQAFKPQNLSFFILPLEYAFAFKWWLLLAALLISSYYFFLKILQKRTVLAILMACLISFSPFVSWWYQSATILPFAYGFLIMLVGMSLIDRSLIKLGRFELSYRTSIVTKSVVLAYLLVSFALVLYPPFQITVAITVFAFLLGYLLNNWPSKINKQTIASIFLPFIASVILAGCVCLIFLATRMDTIHAIASTVYPGKRDVSSGGHNISILLVNYLQPLLQSSLRGGKFILNQSESSSFILLPLFYFIPACWLLVRNYIKKHRINWLLLLLLLCNFIFLSHLTLPLPHIFTHALLLHMVPLERVIAGIGFSGIILVACMISVILNNNLNSSKETRSFLPFLSIYSLGFLVASCLAGITIMHQYPGFIQGKKEIFVLASVLVLAMFLTLTKKVYVGLVVLAIFTAGSVFRINPLYQGLDVLMSNPITHAISMNSNNKTVWAAANDLYLENLPELTGSRAMTGVAAYPNMKFWEQYAGTKSQYIYNRYAHIVGSSSAADSISLIQPDYFVVSTECSKKFTHIVTKVVSSLPLTESCFVLRQKISLPRHNVYIYDVTKR